tara:strand:- start:10761 stop:11825 length:1065 start_codon:yes stop_codon:yes gene_type:complete
MSLRGGLIILKLFATLGLLQNALATAPEKWNSIKIDGRNYVAVADLAKAYSMTRMTPREDPKEIAFGGDKHTLAVKIDSRQSLIDGVRHWLSFPVVSKDENKRVFVSLIDVRSTIVPAFEPGAAQGIGPVKTIVFDPGHGGHDPGGIGLLGVERDYTLDLVKRTRKLLEAKGITVVQNRLSDFFIPLHKRPSMTKNYDAPIFVSLHLNAATNREANGIEIFSIPPLGAPPHGAKPDKKADIEKHPNTPHEPASFILANTIHQALLGKTAAFDRGVKRARFSVLRHASVPAVLVEGGFISHKEEAKRIHTPEWRQKFASALADGIEAYVNLANQKKAPARAVDLNRKPTIEFVPE